MGYRKVFCLIEESTFNELKMDGILYSNRWDSWANDALLEKLIGGSNGRTGNKDGKQD